MRTTVGRAARIVVLTIRHHQHFLVVDQFSQRNVVQEPADALAQIAPQGVGQAAIAALTAFFALATGCIYRFIDGSDDSANGDLTRVFTQQLPTARTAHAGHQAILAQTGE